MTESTPRGIEGLDEFPFETREDVEGLIWLGHLEEEFEYCGHRFVLRTLRADEELYAGVLMKEFNETPTQGKALAWAHVCQALVAVDNDPDFCPDIGADKLTNARGRFNFCTGKWYWHTGDHLFFRYRELVARQTIAVNALRNLSTRSLTPSMPSPDSLTDQGDSENPTEDIQDLLD